MMIFPAISSVYFILTSVPQSVQSFGYCPQKQFIPCYRSLKSLSKRPNVPVQWKHDSVCMRLQSSSSDTVDQDDDGNQSESDEELCMKQAESYFAEVDYAATDPNTSWVTVKRNKPPREQLIKFASEEWRRWRVIKYYEIMTLISVGFFLLNPSVFINSHHKYYPLLHKPIEKVIVVCGEALLILLSRILRGAVVHDRLSSDTYKRLNLAIVLSCVMQLLSMRSNPYHSLYTHSFDFGTAAYQNIAYIWTISYIVLIYAGLKGFIKGVRGFSQLDLEINFPVKDLIKDILNGGIQTLQTFFKIPNKISAGYFLATIACFKSLTSLGIYSAPYLTLFGTTLLTLKDASDRNRLDGGTFVALNGVVSLSSLMAFVSSKTRLSINGFILLGTSILSGFSWFCSKKKSSQ